MAEQSSLSPKDAEKEEKLIIRQFADKDRRDWWLNYKHWTIVDNKPFLCAGGMFIEEEYQHMLKYLKSKKLI